MPSAAISGSKILLKKGDGGIGAGVQASRTIGTSNQQIIIRAKNSGTAGNTKTAAIVVAGVSTPFSIVVTANSVVINSATDGSSVATTTVAQAISALYLNSTFVANFQATVGAGTGSGVLVAAASAALTGGTNGTEIFSNVAEVTGIGGFTLSATTIDVTNLDSTDNTREFITSWIDAGEMTFTCNFIAANAGQQSFLNDMKNEAAANYTINFPSGVVISVRCFVTGLSIPIPIDGKIEMSVTLKLVSIPQWF